jgi:glutathionyl-hydroquinone reductase
MAKKTPPTEIEILKKEIDDLENEQYELPDIEECYCSQNLRDELKTELKDMPRIYKSIKTGISLAGFVKKAQVLLAEMKRIDDLVKAQDKAVQTQYKALQKQIDAKREKLEKLQPPRLASHVLILEVPHARPRQRQL